jgi:flavorubredoxin
MKPIAITPNIFCISVNDSKTKLFEGLWQIEKEGISYNSYLIKDEKNVLIDLCKDIFQEEYLAELESLVKLDAIDYVVVNHMEPDHSGALREFHARAPQAKIIATQKAVSMMRDFSGITENIQVVCDGEKLAVGETTLTFLTAPMVHWPETMLTFDEKSGILCSCDAFGGYGMLTDGIFDDDYADISMFERESLRYFANIVAAFSKPVLNAAEKLAGLPIQVVAPSHGLVWRKEPERIIELYLKWSGYSKGKAEHAVTILHGSMYGNTASMLHPILLGLEKAGVPFAAHDITTTHISYILPDLWQNQGVMIGAPTYEGSIFPTMATVLLMAEYKRIFNKEAAYYGSYGWGGGAMRYLRTQCETLKWHLHDPLEFAGTPSGEDMQAGAAFAEKFGRSLT